MTKVLIPALSLVLGFTLGAYAISPNSVTASTGQKAERLTSASATQAIDVSSMNETYSAQPLSDISIDSLARLLEVEIDQPLAARESEARAASPG